MLSPVVEKFINENIQSVWQLELLLYIRARSDSLRSYDLASALYTSPDAVEDALHYFEKHGLLKRGQFDTSEFIYAPTNAELRDGLDKTAIAYAERKVAIIQYIFSHANVSKAKSTKSTGKNPQVASQRYLDIQNRMDNLE